MAYDPGRTYCANTLLVPTPTPRITPPREALEATREALGVMVLPPEQRQLVRRTGRGRRGRRWYWCCRWAAVSSLEVGIQAPGSSALLPSSPISDLDFPPGAQLVYTSRVGQDSRRISNEEQLLVAVAAAFPAQRLVVHYGNESVDDTIALFQQAQVNIFVAGKRQACNSAIVGVLLVTCCWSRYLLKCCCCSLSGRRQEAQCFPAPA